MPQSKPSPASKSGSRESCLPPSLEPSRGFEPLWALPDNLSERCSTLRILQDPELRPGDAPTLGSVLSTTASGPYLLSGHLEDLGAKPPAKEIRCTA
jgi:hypothetical protein